MAQGKPKLTPEQREEIVRRVLAGESSTAVAKDYGVTRACVSLLKMQAVDPEGQRRKKEAKRKKNLTIKLTDDEIELFHKEVSSGTPESHGLIPAVERWNLDHGYQMAMKLFGKRPSVRVMKELMDRHILRWEDYQHLKPKPPKPHHISQIDPELAKDEDYVAYYLSPICQQIAQREYELALEQWEERYGENASKVREENDDDLDFPGHQPQFMPRHVPGQRVGKHAKSKGSRHTPPKRRKKRR